MVVVGGGEGGREGKGRGGGRKRVEGAGREKERRDEFKAREKKFQKKERAQGFGAVQ